MSIVDQFVPDLGDFKDVEVIDVMVKAGDMVAVDAPLITLETDKATMDVPSTAAGRVATVAVKKGDRVSKGSAVAVLESAAAPAATKASTGSGNSKPAAAPAAPAPGTIAAATTPAAPGPVQAAAEAPAFTVPDADIRRAHAGPSVRRFARELGVDLTRVTGTGVQGRITAEDVKGFVKKALGSSRYIIWSQ